MDLFHRHCTECPVMSRYSVAPVHHTMEALLVNQQMEFLIKDKHSGVWLMGGITLRLAMRMGYHRDPDSYPEITVFEGEMRWHTSRSEVDKC